eukprot:469277-Rhodomonas_salina.2
MSKLGQTTQRGRPPLSAKRKFAEDAEGDKQIPEARALILDAECRLEQKLRSGGADARGFEDVLLTVVRAARDSARKGGKEVSMTDVRRVLRWMRAEGLIPTAEAYLYALAAMTLLTDLHKYSVSHARQVLLHMRVDGVHLSVPHVECVMRMVLIAARDGRAPPKEATQVLDLIHEQQQLQSQNCTVQLNTTTSDLMSRRAWADFVESLCVGGCSMLSQLHSAQPRTSPRKPSSPRVGRPPGRASADSINELYRRCYEPALDSACRLLRRGSRQSLSPLLHVLSLVHAAASHGLSCFADASHVLLCARLAVEPPPLEVYNAVLAIAALCCEHGSASPAAAAQLLEQMDREEVVPTLATARSWRACLQHALNRSLPRC